VLRVVAERGLGGLTYRGVADEAGISLGTLTYHFPTRRELLGAAFRRHLEQVGERGRDFDARSRPAWEAGRLSIEQLTEAVAGFLESMARNDRASVIASHELALEMTRDASLTHEVDAAFATHHRNTAHLVGSVTGRQAADADAAILSAVFDSLVLGSLARPGDAAHAARLRRIVKRLLELLF